MAFIPKHTDFDLSPYTGMTRESWIDAAKYLLGGVFSHIHSPSDPVVMPRTETEITYPHKGAFGSELAAQQSAEKFEGLARSFLIAAPLIFNEPDVELNGIRLRDYYKDHVLRACTEGDPHYIGTYDYIKKLTGAWDKACFQQTVETCALVICLWVSKAQIWDTYERQEKDRIARFISSYAHRNTVPQNWRLFNMLDLAFLFNEGYEIDADIMHDHAMNILAYYAGDGWYRDGATFDYYSAWAFQFYAPLWNAWYGYEHMPHIAKSFEEHSNALMRTYSDMFDRDGFTNMWGRSCIYRFAAVSAFDGNFMLKNPTADPGLSRRISSGSLLQFLTRDDFLNDGVPTLGFYGKFSPLVQGYSCAESPLWMGKAFLCLHLPPDHPFWTAKENNGSWEKLSGKEIKRTVLDGPALCFTNHAANGVTYLRTGKIVKQKGDAHGMDNYSKLVYAAKYPWESSLKIGVSSQQYVIEDKTNGKLQTANVTLWIGEKNGALYRRQLFDYDLSTDSTWVQAITLADFSVPYGIFRADKLRLYTRPVKITLGTFGFPDNGTKIERRQKGEYKCVILKGYDAAGHKKQLAFSIFDGFSDIEIVKSRGTNPDSENSIVAYAVTHRDKEYGYEQYILCSQTLTREDHDDFTDEELFPLVKVSSSDPKNYSVSGDTTLYFRDGSEKKVNFDGIEGRLSL